MKVTMKNIQDSGLLLVNLLELNCTLRELGII